MILLPLDYDVLVLLEYSYQTNNNNEYAIPQSSQFYYSHINCKK